MSKSDFLKRYQSRVEFKGDYISGTFLIPKDRNGEICIKSPADLSDEVAKISYSFKSIEDAVTAARIAWKPWKALSVAVRAQYLKKYQDALKRRETEICEMISREVGKPLWESKTEHGAMIAKVDITINESMKWVSDFEIPGILENTLGTCRFRPHGVMAVIGPFNFPGHLANGHIVPALLTGNTVIFKPSEKSPLVGQIMAECFHEAGIPAGVFQLVQGEREVGRRLCVHEGISGILFTGSYEVGTRIKQDTLQQHWKILALEMGGKNPVIIWPDEKGNLNLEQALFETLTGAFLTAGQRCSATSRVIIHEKWIDAFLSKFHERSKAFKIGHPTDQPFMGPLIDSSSVDRYMKFQGIASREGAEMIMRGKALELPVQGHYVTPSICWVKDASIAAAKKSVYQQTELFGPNVAVLASNDLDHAISLANVTQYGLSTSVFTPSESIYRHCYEELEFGLINWNKTTVGASSRLPFGGLKKSGNHFPTAVMATQYCAYPIASLEVAEPSAPNPKAYSGLEWT